MMPVNNPTKPSKDVLFARDSLEDILLAEVKKTPMTPANLLQLVSTRAGIELGVVTAYLHSTGFISASSPGIQIVYHVLGINWETGVGKKVMLTGVGAETVVKYFPGYTPDTLLREFLMQELVDYPRTLITFKQGRRRVTHPRSNYANNMIRSVYDAILRYQHTQRTRLGISTRTLTIGDFLGLPQEVIKNNEEVYRLVEPYGFSSGRNLAKR